MTAAYTREQVFAMAPDASSAKAAQKLLSPGRWPVLEYDDAAVWGECKGSGAKPYLVQFDRQGTAFKCSCPSRKFPCKHGLAMLALFADAPGSFKSTPAPPRVTEWLESRQERTESRAKRSAERAAKPQDPEAAAKQAAKRRDEMEAGLKDFDLWLQDLVRQGLAALPGRDADYWRQPAARLVDAKAPGMARWIEDARRSADDAPRALAALGHAYLLRRAFARFDDLSPEQQADVRAAIGWALDKDAVRADEPVREPVQVLGTSVLENDRLREQRVWLRGQTSGRPALILSFAFGQQPFEVLLSPGTVVDLELDFYPSAVPLRALVRAQHGEPRPLTAMAGFDRLEDALDQVASWLAENPWLDRLPLTLASMRFLPDGEGWLLTDGDKRALPVHRSFRDGWDLAALAGGRPVDLFGEWRPQGFMPLGCLGDDGYVSFVCEEVA